MNLNFKRVAVIVLFLSAIFAGAKNNAEAATVSQITTAVQKAYSLSHVLKNAISIEYNGDGKQRPYKELKNTQNAYKEAKRIIGKSPLTSANADKMRIVEERIKHGIYYIDAINGGLKIVEKRVFLENLLKQGILTAETVKGYHSLSYEIKKQAKLLDRVYGRTTRDFIRDYYKETAEQLRNEMELAVTVKMALLEIDSLSESGAEEALLKQGKTVLNFISAVPQDNYKDSLYKEWETKKSKINTIDAEYTNLTVLDGSIRKIGELIKPGLSSPKVPVLYNDVMDRSEAVANPKAKALFPRTLQNEMKPLFLSVKEIKAILTKKALEAGIPPEVAKAIAKTENGELKQFNTDGDVFRSFDNGLGIMQVTPLDGVETGEYWDGVKYDLEYNIEAGLNVLMDKWNLKNSRRIPTVNDGDINVLENWYFAIMAYNGLLQRNDPTLVVVTYQDKVHGFLNNAGVAPEKVVVNKGDISYTPEMKLIFNILSYTTSAKTKSLQNAKPGDIVTVATENLRFRSAPSTEGKELNKLQPGDKFKIISGPYEDENLANLFSWYEVKLSSTGQVGYVSSQWGQQK